MASTQAFSCLLESHAEAGQYMFWSLRNVRNGSFADATGMTPVHMNRVLQRLRAAGLIRWTARRLTVLDAEGLSKASGFDAHICTLGMDTA